MRTDQTARGEQHGGRDERADHGGARSSESAGTGAGAAARSVAARGARGLTPGAATALQRSAGNAAFAAAVGRDAHTHGPGCGHGASVQRSATDNAAVQRSAVHDVLRSSGRPMDDATRTDMESRLGADFSDVRIHDNAAAKASAAEVGARAYTSGSHVVIGNGGNDKHTLAHELTHVIQQRQGPVAGTDNGSGLKVSDPTDRFEREAEANATRAMQRSATPEQAPGAPETGGGADGAVQRVAAPRTPAPGDPAAVQRKTGFEFEAQWNVRKVEDPEGADKTTHERRMRDRETTIDVELLTTLADPNNQRWGRWPEGTPKPTGALLEGDVPTADGRAVLEQLDLAQAGPGREEGPQRAGAVHSLMTRSKVPEVPLPGENLGKGVEDGLLIAGTGFDLTADASPSGGSNLEWITTATDDRGALSGAMDSITAMAGYLDGRSDDAYIRSEEVTAGGGRPKPNLRIYPANGKLKFSPQTTAGIRLDRLPDLVKFLDTSGVGNLKKKIPEKVNPWHPKERDTARKALYNVPKAGNLGTATTGAKRAVAALPQTVPADGRPALVGLVSMLASYLLESQTLQDGGNAKSIAGGLMARNDFARGYATLPLAMRQYYSAAPAEFAALVMSAAQAGTIQGGLEAKVFPKTVERGLAGDRTEREIPLTRKQWLEAIPEGKDLLKNYAKLSAEEKADEAVTGNEDAWEGVHKSLGTLRAEETATDRRGAEIPLMIAEFRRMNALNVATKDLKPLAMAAFDLLERLNTGRKLRYGT